MKLALAQMNIHWEDKNKNKITILKFLKEAKENQVDLILFPEMTLTGFSMRVSSLGEYSQEPSSTLNWFLEAAALYNLTIGFGHIEIDPLTKKGLNMFTVVSPSKEIKSSYTKIHPFSFGLESKYYKGGPSITSFPLKDFTLSTFICYDLRFPEIFQGASEKSHLITVSANWPQSRKDHWITLLKARAIENQCYIAGINRVGIGDNIKYSGNSMIIDPSGEVLCSNEGDEVLLVKELELAALHDIRNNFNLKADRRETLYRKFYLKEDEN